MNLANLPEMLREAAYEPSRLDDCLDAIERTEHVRAGLRSERLAAVRRLGKPEAGYGTQ